MDNIDNQKCDMCLSGSDNKSKLQHRNDKHCRDLFSTWLGQQDPIFINYYHGLSSSVKNEWFEHRIPNEEPLKIQDNWADYLEYEVIYANMCSQNENSKSCFGCKWCLEPSEELKSSFNKWVAGESEYFEYMHKLVSPSQLRFWINTCDPDNFQKDWIWYCKYLYEKVYADCIDVQRIYRKLEHQSFQDSERPLEEHLKAFERFILSHEYKESYCSLLDSFFTKSYMDYIRNVGINAGPNVEDWNAEWQSWFDWLLEDIFDSWLKDKRSGEILDYYDSLDIDERINWILYTIPGRESVHIHDHWEQFYGNACVDKFYSE